jgi:hypothetical protein
MCRIWWTVVTETASNLWLFQIPGKIISLWIMINMIQSRVLPSSERLKSKLMSKEAHQWIEKVQIQSSTMKATNIGPIAVAENFWRAAMNSASADCPLFREPFIKISLMCCDFDEIPVNQAHTTQGGLLEMDDCVIPKFDV